MFLISLRNQFRMTEMNVSISGKRALVLLGATLAIGYGISRKAVVAADERRVKGDEIHAVLSGARVVGKGYEQLFGDPRGHDSAPTTYWEGKNASFGRWRVEDDQYCSQWGNFTYWTCYEMRVGEENGAEKVIWIDTSGRRFEGIVEKEGAD